MIKAISQSVCSGITGCQVELLGSGAELIKEYKEVTAAMYRSLRGHMPEELAKEVLVRATGRVIIEQRADRKDPIKKYNHVKKFLPKAKKEYKAGSF